MMNKITRKISKEELKKILENHKHWIKRDVDGWWEMCADLSDVDLHDANLRNADLREARMFNTDLSKSDLCGIKLDNAAMYNINLRGAKLCGASLYNTDLHTAVLNDADFSGADLRYADLHNADLYGVNLCNTDLRNANFRNAVLCGADLLGSTFYSTDLRGADLHKAILPNQKIMNSIFPLYCPEEGTFIGWKRAFLISNDPVIVKLRIPNRAKRSSATSRKCRCDRATVLDIQSLDGESLSKKIIAHSRYDFSFTYEVGQKLYIENFDEDRWNECSTGIHFFITRQEAVDYIY